MPRLFRKVRLLYLLALFQVLGGPAVLCGVLAFVRLASDRQLTLEQHAARALERVQSEQGTPERAVLTHTDDVPDLPTPAAPAPEKVNEGKVKFTGIAEGGGSKFMARASQWVGLSHRHDPVLIKRSQLPLLRPPRLG